MFDKKKQNNIALLLVGMLVCFFSDLVFIVADVVYGTAQNVISKYAGSNVSFCAFVVMFIGLLICFIATLNLRKFNRKLCNAWFLFIAGLAACLFQFFNTFFLGMVLGGGFEYGIEFAPVFQYMWFEGVDVMLCVVSVAGFAFALYGFVEMLPNAQSFKAAKTVDRAVILFAIMYGIGESFEITIISNLDNVQMMITHTTIAAIICAVGMLTAYISLLIWFIGFIKETSSKKKVADKRMAAAKNNIQTNKIEQSTDKVEQRAEDVEDTKKVTLDDADMDAHSISSAPDAQNVAKKEVAPQSSPVNFVERN